MFVGDSLNRGQWISMVCLLQSVIPREKQSMSPNAHLTIFRAEVINTFQFICLDNSLFCFWCDWLLWCMYPAGLQCHGGVSLGTVARGIEF